MYDLGLVDIEKKNLYNLSKIVQVGGFVQVNLYRFQVDFLGKLFCTWFSSSVNLKIVEDDNVQPLAGTNSAHLS